VLFFQSVNMKNGIRNVVLYSNGKLDVELDVDIIALNSVEITADRDINVTTTQMGISKFTSESVKNVPVLLGERDIIEVATTTSGVQTLGEGSAGINVRGGKAALAFRRTTWGGPLSSLRSARPARGVAPSTPRRRRVRA
jgi:hypothetical protein